MSWVISCANLGPFASRRPSAATNASYRSSALALAAWAAGSGSAGVVVSQKRMNTASVSTEMPTSRSIRVIRLSS